MKHLLLVAHPDSGSLTMEVARTYAAELARLMHPVNLCDLYRIGFDPVLPAGETSGELPGPDVVRAPRTTSVQRMPSQ